MADISKIIDSNGVSYDIKDSTARTAIAGKQDALPQVVNDRYLHTNSSTGALEWSVVQGGGGGTWGSITGTLSDQTDLQDELDTKIKAYIQNIEPQDADDGDIWVDTNGTPTHTLFDFVYPVGSIYMSVNSVSPSTLFGGSWEQLKDTLYLTVYMWKRTA